MEIKRQKGKRKVKNNNKNPECLLVGHQFRGLTAAEKQVCIWKWTKTLWCLSCRGQAHHGTGLLGVFSDVDHWAAFDNDQLIIIARNSTSTLKSSLPASWLKETREIVLYSLIHGISLIIAVSEVVKKNAVSNCRCLLWSAEHSMSDRWSRKWISANKISFAFHKRVLDFCLCAFQCGRGSAQKP